MIDIEWAEEHFNRYSNFYRLYGDYYNGKHKNYFADLDNKNHEQLAIIIKHLKDNMCKVVVDSLTSRMELEGFDTEDVSTLDYINEYFDNNRLTSIAKAVHRDAVLYGDSYLLVYPDSTGKPKVYHERPFNMAVRYDIDGNIVMAVKWIVEKISTTIKRSRYWIYTPDYIYCRYKDSEQAPGDFNTLLPYGDNPDIVNPYGRVPVFHFYNGIRQDAFCRSDLGDVVPLQIALNKELQSRELASDLAAFRQKWITGASVPIGEDGKPMSDLKTALDNIWMFSNADVKLGEFSTTDLENYTKVANDIREEIARVSRVPFHIMGLGSDFPSGEALKTAEAPLIAKISDKQLMLGDVWEDVMAFVLELAGKGTDKPLMALWTNTQPHSEKEQWEIALMKKDTGVSTDQVLEELGYTPEQIVEFNNKSAETTSANTLDFNAGD